MLEYRSIVVRPILTENSYKQLESQKFTFEVAKKANKGQIKEAIEKLFDVTVEKVWISYVKGKSKRGGIHPRHITFGKTGDWKKAIVKLKEGDFISAFEGA